MWKLIILVAALWLSACVQETPKAQQTKVAEAAKAAAAANSITFTENAEIENIKSRLKLTSNPGLLGYVVLLNEMGQPVMYTGVKGKITSGSKRLTASWQLARVDCGQYLCDKDVPSPSDEGTYGTSGEYIFFWTPSGQYIQWNGKYLYSDKPFRLSVQPVVVSVEAQEVKK